MTAIDHTEFALRMRRRAFIARALAVLLAAIPWTFAVYFAALGAGGMR